MTPRTAIDWPLVGLAALVCWAPLPLGSNRDWAVGVFAVGAVASLMLTWGWLLRQDASPIAYLRPAAIPLASLMAYMALLAGQCWGGLTGLASPSHWALGTGDPYQTGHYLLRSAVYVCLFVLTLLVVRDSGRARLLALVLVASGLVQALAAIVLLSSQASYHFLYEHIRHSNQTTGSFVNRNHLAGYLCLSLSVGIGLLLGGAGQAGPAPRRWRDHAVNLMKFVLSRRMTLRVLLVVMVIALVLTRSRMGNTAFFTSLVALGLVAAATVPAWRGRALWLVLSVVIVDILVIGQWVGLDRVVQRLDQTALTMEDARGEETVEARLEPARHTLAMVQARPWFGYGGGSYYTAFPEFKSRQMLLHLYYFDHAHNDYAEIAADTGLIGLGLLALVVLSTLWRVRKLLSRRQPALTRGIGYGAVMAISWLLLHSMVDFNLQIPANAATLMVVLGLVWAVPTARRRSAGPAPGVADGADAPMSSLPTGTLETVRLSAR